MDWSNVTAEDLIEALREVDWSSPPRPVSEFFSRFTLPRSYAKWNSRLKCNLYYYRTNYFIMIVFILGKRAKRVWDGVSYEPLAIVAALTTALSIAFLNDSFAGTFSEKVTRTVRQFSPHLAAKMRPSLTPVIRGRPSAKRAIHICGRPRWVFVLVFSIVSFILWSVSCGILTVLWAFAIGLLGSKGRVLLMKKIPCVLVFINFRFPDLQIKHKGTDGSSLHWLLYRSCIFSNGIAHTLSSPCQLLRTQS
ncbi:PRA1 family protein A1 [Sesamum angolense]|uniref:PRA1 family protein n=1 Tax=Sesamum angolense TaxID=2727404 RepID=A0AAE1WMV1_9LAMI|nr:PRA1 family protein A1 [Sesamum angolense]